MGWLGAGEIIVILILILLFFGPKSIPEAGKIIGKGLRDLKKFSEMAESDLLTEEKQQEQEAIPDEPTPSPDFTAAEDAMGETEKPEDTPAS